MQHRAVGGRPRFGSLYPSATVSHCYLQAPPARFDRSPRNIGVPSKGFIRVSGSPGLGAVLCGVALEAFGSVEDSGDGLRRRKEDVKVRAAMGLTTACLNRTTAERRRNIVGLDFGAVVGAFQGGELQECGLLVASATMFASG